MGGRGYVTQQVPHAYLIYKIIFCLICSISALYLLTRFIFSYTQALLRFRRCIDALSQAAIDHEMQSYESCFLYPSFSLTYNRSSTSRNATPLLCDPDTPVSSTSLTTTDTDADIVHPLHNNI